MLTVREQANRKATVQSSPRQMRSCFRLVTFALDYFSLISKLFKWPFLDNCKISRPNHNIFKANYVLWGTIAKKKNYSLKTVFKKALGMGFSWQSAFVALHGGACLSRGSEAQSHPWVHSEFKAILGYVRLCLQKGKKIKFKFISMKKSFRMFITYMENNKLTSRSNFALPWGLCINLIISVSPPYPTTVFHIFQRCHPLWIWFFIFC